jgi:predicted permease
MPVRIRVHEEKAYKVKIVFNPPLAALVIGFFYAVGFLAYTLNQTKATLLKRPVRFR